jgi:hypothetical protein
MANLTAWPAMALPPAGLPSSASSLQAETEVDRLQRALAEVEADLERHKTALSKLQRELMASRLEVSGARSETVQFHGLLRRSQAEATKAVAEAATAHAQIATLEADAASGSAEIPRLQAVIASLQAETLALRAGMDVLRASLSWRISAPVRVVGRLTRGIVARMRSLLQATWSRLPPSDQAEVATSPPAPLAPPGPSPHPTDPNDGYIFQAAPLAELRSGEAEGVLTLDALYHLSRSL